MKNSLFCVGIAGGSGSGKTSLAYALQNQMVFADKVNVLHLDNYQRFDIQPKEIAGLPNWDDPAFINWSQLKQDLTILKSGRSVLVTGRDQETLTYNISFKLLPRPILIVEGYLLLHDSKIRSILDCKLFLEASDKTRVERRTKMKNQDYVTQVLLPMHHQYIEPTKQWADHTLNTEILTTEACCEIATRLILKRYASHDSVTP